jgi:hypothetical protein
MDVECCRESSRSSRSSLECKEDSLLVCSAELFSPRLLLPQSLCSVCPPNSDLLSLVAYGSMK